MAQGFGLSLPRDQNSMSTPGDVFLGAEPFKYHALSAPEPEIRLLELRGRHDSYRDVGYTITCELLHVKVEELPQYIALSYCWGDTTDPVHSILVNGQDFKIRENLWLALSRLQPNSGCFLIWIDAICINQEDNLERNEQVRMMRTIYERAHHVCVWLGPEEDDSCQAMKFLKDLNRCAEDEKLLLELFKIPNLNWSLVALAELYNRPYWYRIWIVQELVLANHIWVFCGRHCVPWEAFESTRKSIGEMSTDSEVYRLFFENTDIWSLSILRNKNDGPMLIDVTRTKSREQDLGLFETVSTHWPKDASDPRDLIYGVLGIVDEEESQNIDIDYLKPVARLYTDFAKLVIENSRRLDILIVANNSDLSMADLPSWVPDWSKEPQGPAQSHPRCERPCWNSSGTTEAQFLFTGEDKILIVGGLEIGHIKFKWESTHRCTDDYDDLECAVDTFLYWLDMIESTGGNLQKNTLALANLLTTGDYLSHDEEDIEELAAVIAAFACWSTKTTRFNPRIAEYLPYNLNMSDEDFRIWSSRRIRNASNWMRYRCLSLSSSGTFGFVPKCVVEGDILCIPLGCLSPFVLRPCGNYYTVIGEAYVQGFMNGEAIELLEMGDLKVQDFELH